MLLTEGKLLLWHFIISVVAAVLLLWSAQLTRNFNFTNGHWFPIADIVYCLLVSSWIIPRLGVTPAHFLSEARDMMIMWGLVSRGQWSPGLACHNLYRMTRRGALAINTNDATRGSGSSASGWWWHSSFVTNNPTVSLSDGWLSAHCGMDQTCVMRSVLSWNTIMLMRDLCLLSLNRSLIAQSTYNRGLLPGSE